MGSWKRVSLGEPSSDLERFILLLVKSTHVCVDTGLAQNSTTIMITYLDQAIYIYARIQRYAAVRWLGGGGEGEAGTVF